MPNLLFPSARAKSPIAALQAKLLKRAKQSGEPLSLILQEAGWSFDDLVYEKSRIKTWNGPGPLTLDKLRIPDTGIPLVSFFTGCGGMDLGLEATGYRQVASFEINELFCKTLRRNRPQWRVFGPPTHSGDVSKFDDIASTLRGMISAPFDGLFVGGPPCQPFSIAANQRFAKWGDNFKRTGFAHAKNGNLLFDFVRLIAEFRPRSFIIENVPGLRDLDGGEQLSAAFEELESAGYTVEQPFVLDASHFGIAQQRQRLFIVGSRLSLSFKRPEPANLPVGAGSVLKGGLPDAPNNETREHKAESVLRYRKLDYGQRDQLGRVDRLDPALPSKTVIAGGTNGGGRSHLHPEIPRTLSVRESARLQTFPEDFVFVGPTARQFTQVGNAVPPVLAAQLGISVLKSYFDRVRPLARRQK
ncbi:MAG: DNA cytosine methyltransferase [Acidobacteriaceae bacterium]